MAAASAARLIIIMRIVLADLDGSLPGQTPLEERVAKGRAESIDLRDMGPSLRIVARRKTLAQFISAFGPTGAGPEVVFYGSGDFHHLTAGLLLRQDRPLTVIHFDNHPDWVLYPRTFNCGAWVNRALDMPHVQRVITIGPCSEDLVRPELQMANLGALRDGRLELYPWRHGPSRVFRQYGDGPDRRQKDGFLHWRELSGEDWSGFLDELIARLSPDPLYITIDKDVLTSADATTNWDQGGLPLNHLLQAVEKLAEARAIVGVDVCGDYSKPMFRDPFRAALAYFDHPAQTPPTPASLAINATTNEALLDCFERVLH